MIMRFLIFHWNAISNHFINWYCSKRWRIIRDNSQSQMFACDWILVIFSCSESIDEFILVAIHLKLIVNPFIHRNDNKYLMCECVTNMSSAPNEMFSYHFYIVSETNRPNSKRWKSKLMKCHLIIYLIVCLLFY